MRRISIILFLFCLSINGKAQTWHTMGLGVTGGIALTPTVIAIYDYNNKITIGGFFKKSGSTILNGIGQWDGNLWQPMGTGILYNFLLGDSGIGHDMKEYNGKLYFGGNFSVAGGANEYDTMKAANNITKWDGIAWQPMTQRNDGLNSGCSALQVYHNNLYLGGAFNVSLDSSGSHFDQDILKWNDTVFSPIGNFYSNHPSGNDFTMDLCVYNDKLIAGGYFNCLRILLLLSYFFKIGNEIDDAFFAS